MGFSSILHTRVRKSKSIQSAALYLRGELLEYRRLLAGPSVTSLSPINTEIGIAVAAKVSAAFDVAIDPATLNSNTFQLRDPSNNLIAARISYNNVNHTATLDADLPLDYFTAYTATIQGGPDGVKDLQGDPLEISLNWTFTTAAMPQTGPGGPILIVTATSNPFSTYYAEILRAEGLNEFSTADIASVSTESLAAYQEVVLGEMPLTSTQATMFGDWVDAGGNLIAMRPDSQLSGLLGITSLGTTLSEGYLLVNTASGPGMGIVGQTMQYHGTADEYALNGASSVATLYSSVDQSTPSPAVTIRNVGTNGGQAAAFAYDLAKSIIYTRQGNPAWSGQARSGIFPFVETSDLFLGNAAGDPQPDWVDFSKIAIPQADEQQRLLANMLTEMEADQMPLPRLWYFPDGAKAIVIMTGDDHGIGGTNGRFDTYYNDDPSGGRPITSTSYIYAAPSTTDEQAAQFTAEGFEVALHVVVGSTPVPQNWVDAAQLNSIYDEQLSTFESTYSSIPTPSTIRTHAVVWSDYDTQPQVEFAHRIRLDTNYYYYPTSWVQDRPGLMTGSGMVMRFAKADGTMIDVYQAATQITDESGQSEPKTIETLLNNALGSLGYYGVFTINMHTNVSESPESDIIIAATQAHGVQVMAAQDVLNWVDGRNESSFSSLSWNGTTNTLSFGMTVANGASGLMAMLPAYNADRILTNLTHNGSAVSFSIQTIKGVAYAFFDANAGSFTAEYELDTQSPMVLDKTPASEAAGVAVTTTVQATFGEPIVPATLSFILRDSLNDAVPAIVTYDPTTGKATLTPDFALDASVTYTATLSGAMDQIGNTMADVVWSFTTGASSGNSIVIENSLTGTDQSVWDISGAGDLSIQGFATDISVNVGQTIDFKIDDTALAPYHIDIYRLGYYDGLGARLISTIDSTATLQQDQPSPLTDAATGLIDCGNWSVSASWDVPENAVSGIYIAKVERDDSGGASHIVFIVRNDDSGSDLLFKTSDSTWEAYNDYGGNSFYAGGPGTDPGRAYAVSYNRPFNTRAR